MVMKRYDSLEATYGESMGMEEDPKGDWIRFDDLPQWIPVGERLPEAEEVVLLAAPWGTDHDISIMGWLDPDCKPCKWYTYGGPISPEVTHWMPLPEPPE